MFIEFFKHFVFKTVVHIFAKWVIFDEGYYDLNIFLLSKFHCFVYDNTAQEEIHTFVDLFSEGFFQVSEYSWEKFFNFLKTLPTFDPGFNLGSGQLSFTSNDDLRIFNCEVIWESVQTIRRSKLKQSQKNLFSKKMLRKYGYHFGILVKRILFKDPISLQA